MIKPESAQGIDDFDIDDISRCHIEFQDKDAELQVSIK